MISVITNRTPPLPDYATLQDEAIDRRDTVAARIAGYEIRLRVRSRRSAGQGFSADELTSVCRWRMEASNARNLLATRTAALNQRRASTLAQELERDDEFSDLCLRLNQCEARLEEAEDERNEFARCLAEQQEDAQRRLQETRRNEVLGIMRIHTLKTSLAASIGNQAVGSDNRAGGGPRRPGYVAGPITKDEILPIGLRKRRGF